MIKGGVQEMKAVIKLTFGGKVAAARMQKEKPNSGKRKKRRRHKKVKPFLVTTERNKSRNKKEGGGKRKLKGSPCEGGGDNLSGGVKGSNLRQLGEAVFAREGSSILTDWGG